MNKPEYPQLDIEERDQVISAICSRCQKKIELEEREQQAIKRALEKYGSVTIQSLKHKC